jgi:hypothetical protein
MIFKAFGYIIKLTFFHYQVGKAVHVSFDLLLISAVLAGIKRSTGLTYVITLYLLSISFLC